MAKSSTTPKYPWAELYDIESGAKRSRMSTPSTGRGRPPSMVKRHRTTITLLDEERKIFEKLTYAMKERLHPHTVTKGQVLGLALRFLDAQVEAIPGSLADWEQLVDLLFEQEDDKGE